MGSRYAIVSKILKFSCVDGPGNRFVIFLQGCNFRCLNCHNPHTMGHCNHCAECVPHCPSGALSYEANHVLWDKALCLQCDRCLLACPRHANPMVQHYRVDELLEMIRAQQFFIGGVTVSGGEATTQAPFIQALFEAIRSDRELHQLNLLIDSNGHLSQSGWQKLLPVCDGVMLDLKCWNSALHQTITGQNNTKVLTSLALLHRANKLHEVRLLIIPGVTDPIAQIQPIAEYLAALSVDIKVRLNAFQHHGVQGQALNWRPCRPEDIEAVSGQLKQAGLHNIIHPSLYL